PVRPGAARGPRPPSRVPFRPGPASPPGRTCGPAVRTRPAVRESSTAPCRAAGRRCRTRQQQDGRRWIQLHCPPWEVYYESGSGRPRYRRRERKRDHERRAFPDLGFDRDGPTHGVEELTRDVEAEAAAAHAPRHLCVRAVELLEDQALLGHRDPQALVANGDVEFLRARLQLDLDATSARRILDSVRDEVRQNLSQLVAVAEQ